MRECIQPNFGIVYSEKEDRRAGTEAFSLKGESYLEMPKYKGRMLRSQLSARQEEEKS